MGTTRRAALSSLFNHGSIPHDGDWIGGRNNTAEKLGKLRRERAKNFADDHRHTLYREYLRVVAVHQPSVFVMENVKGILSARLQQNRSDGESTDSLMFDSIRRDLADPWVALSGDPDHRMLDRLRLSFGNSKNAYRLCSFVAEPEDLFDQPTNSDFVIRSERYGVPQQRHRVIILGIRADISASFKPLVSCKTPITVRDVLAALPKSAVHYPIDVRCLKPTEEILKRLVRGAER